MHLQRHSIAKERRSCDVLPSKQADWAVLPRFHARLTKVVARFFRACRQRFHFMMKAGTHEVLHSPLWYSFRGKKASFTNRCSTEHSQELVSWMHSSFVVWQIYCFSDRCGDASCAFEKNAGSCHPLEYFLEQEPLFLASRLIQLSFFSSHRSGNQ